MTYFKEEIFLLSEGTIFQIFRHKNPKKIETPQKKKNAFSKNLLIYLLLIKNFMKHSNFQKFCQNQWTLVLSVRVCQCFVYKSASNPLSSILIDNPCTPL
jgi:hypothetical protein